MNRRCAFTVILLLLLCACVQEPDRLEPVSLSISRTLGSQDTEAYRRALHPRTFAFPADHGSHPEYKNEWWYFTGNVRSGDGRLFGYQFTLFRNSIAPDSPVSDSAWASNQIFLAHAALSDAGNERFYFDERYSRGAMGLAGVETGPLQLWLENWSVQEGSGSGNNFFAVDVSVAAEGFDLQLRLETTQPMVLHGDQGLSAKSVTPGNASYYYSYTRMHTTGTIQVNDSSHAVTGDSWFDHEWSTSALEKEQAGWDWFSLQLSDQSEIMLFQLRHKSDPARNYYSGSLIHADGRVETLGNDDFVLRAVEFWSSPVTGTRYPSRWELEMFRSNSRLSVIPLMPDQEMNTSFRYWEGAVSVEGSVDGADIRGHGYVEMTGYN